MRGTVYRGTALSRARDEEFGTGEVHGRSIDLVSGFMDPAEADEDWSGTYVDDLPWEHGPESEEEHIVGGLSERLGAAASFAGGGVPVVMHYDGSEIPDLTRIHYSYEDYDARPGTLAWVDGSATGELRVNGDLYGLLNANEGQQAIKYYGDGLVSICDRYNDEMEWVVRGQEYLDVSSATKAAVAYVRRPVAHLSSLDDYARLDTRMTTDETIVGDWSDDRACEELRDIIRRAAPSGIEVYVVHANTMLVMESWGYEPSQVDAIYGPDGQQDADSAPFWLLGD